jgi:hypothetical protein
MVGSTAGPRAERGRRSRAREPSHAAAGRNGVPGAGQGTPRFRLRDCHAKLSKPAKTQAHVE